MMAAPNGRARRAQSNMLEITSIWALLFKKYSSFWMAAHLILSFKTGREGVPSNACATNYGYFFLILLPTDAAHSQLQNKPGMSSWQYMGRKNYCHFVSVCCPWMQLTPDYATGWKWVPSNTWAKNYCNFSSFLLSMNAAHSQLRNRPRMSYIRCMCNKLWLLIPHFCCQQMQLILSFKTGQEWASCNA